MLSLMILKETILLLSYFQVGFNLPY
jgi:hypothetical protein